MCNLSQGIEDRAIERGKDLGRTEGISLGIERGAAEKAIEVAKKMLKSKMSLDDVVKFSGLSVEAVQGLTTR